MALAIHDSLNGRVELSPLESDLIATPPLLRLSRIHQLGLGSLVFPGATHSRFSHSLGVMHVAGLIAKQLDLPPEEEALLRVAGLCHDIGQYPLSHCIELVYRMIGDPDRDPVKEVFETPEAVPADPDLPLLQLATRMRPSSGEAKDKAIGKEVVLRRGDIRAVFERHGKADAFVEEVARVLSGTHTDTLYQAILNSDYDADRLDYVRRDSTMAGLVYGQVDLDYLISSFAVRKWPVTSDNRVLAVHKRKGIGALEHYLLARYHMYSQVIFHRTVRSLELMAKAVFLGLARSGEVYSSYKDILEVIETDSFLNFDDSYFLTALRECVSNDKVSEEIRGLAIRVLRRDRLTTVSDIRMLAEGEDDAAYRHAVRLLTQPDMLAVLTSRAGVDPRDVVVDRVPAIELVPIAKEMSTQEYIRLADRFERGADMTDELRAIAIAPRLYLPDDDRTWLLIDDPVSLIRYLASRQLLIIRVYLATPDRDAAYRLHREIAAEVPAAAVR